MRRMRTKYILVGVAIVLLPSLSLAQHGSTERIAACEVKRKDCMEARPRETTSLQGKSVSSEEDNKCDEMFDECVAGKGQKRGEGG